MKTIVATLVLGMIIVFAVIWFGLFNVAANEKHLSITTQFLELVRHRSISVRSKSIEVPDLDDKELIKGGAEHYAEMCAGCHLAPGMEATELHSGLYPKPPVFSESNYDNSPKAQFWVIKNGVKMSGMPAWSPAHHDEEIWAMVAFIKKMKSLNSEQYQALAIESEGGHHSNESTSNDNNDGHNHSH